MPREHKRGRKCVGGVNDVILMHDYPNKSSWHRDLGCTSVCIFRSV